VCEQIISFDELRTDYKNPIDQCNSLNPVSANLMLLPLEFNFAYWRRCYVLWVWCIFIVSKNLWRKATLY